MKLHNFLPLILRMTVNEVRKFKAVMGIYILKNDVSSFEDFCNEMRLTVGSGSYNIF